VRPVTLKIVLFAAPLFAVGGALGLSAIAGAAPDRQRLDDIQIGEAGAIVRVALLCRGPCDVAPSADAATAGSFLLRGIEEDIDLDLAGRGGLAERLRLKPVDGGSLLTIEANAALNSARVIDCATESGPARCVEFRFDRDARIAAAPPPATRAPATRAPAAVIAPRARPVRRSAVSPATVSAPLQGSPAATPGLRSDAPPATAADGVPFIGAIVLDAAAPLRVGADERLVVPEFAPPERLAPPRPSQGVATELKERVLAPAPASGQPFSIAREMEAILGKTADIGTCEGAAARLSADAWALASMVDLAFCKAASGSLEDADADFTRLLAYTPDNYEALVGRGLIALSRGERARGLGFLQEALNALPPIEESDRIAEAMVRL
jgi:hypothetical protein